MLAGLTTGQIVTTPSGVMFMHTGHDRVDKMTGDPAFGGIVRSTDGVNWTLDNAGIGEIFQIPNMNTWIDGNGRADAHPFAFDGEDIYTVTTSGKIFMQSLGAGGGTDTGSDAGTGSDTNSDPGSSDTSSGPGTGDPGSSGSGPTSDTPTDAGPGGSTGAGSTSGGLDQDAGGCSCRGGDAPASTLLGLTTLLVLQTRRRRGPGRGADLRSV